MGAGRFPAFHAAGKNFRRLGDQWCDQHGQAGDDQHELSDIRRQQGQAHSQADDDEGEFAALSQQQAGFERGMAGQAEGKAEARRDNRLHKEQAEHGQGNPHRLVADHPPVDAHADGHEEQSQHQALEGLQIDLDLVAVFRFGQQQAGKKGAERHGQAGIAGDRGDADDGQQHRRHEHLGAAGLRDQAQGRAQDQPPDHIDRNDGQRRLAERQSQVPAEPAVELGAEHPDHEQDGHHGQVLHQQDRETGPAQGRADPAALQQQLHDDRRRRQGKTGAEDDRGPHRVAEFKGDQADDRAGHQDLQAAQAEHQPAHGP